MPDLFTLAVLLIAISNIGIIILLSRLTTLILHHTGADLIHLVLLRLSEAADRQRGIKQLIRDEHKETRQRIAQVKTRMADEERDDQAAKRKIRESNAQSR